jgi:hypothetical protein
MGLVGGNAMRMMLKVKMSIEGGNRAANDGSLSRTIDAALERLQPEAAYFYAEDGMRAFLMVFDMKSESQIPEIAEPLFAYLGASVELLPVMSHDELRKGFAASLT